MTLKTKTLTGEKLLKRSGSYWRKPVLTSAIVVYAFALLFTIGDALTVNFVMDKLFKDMFLFSTLLTVSMSVILDVVPAFVPILYKKLAYYKQRDENYMVTFIKASLIFAIVAWIIVFVALCIVRSVNANLIMAKSLEAYKEMQADSAVDLTFGKMQTQVLMLFLDAVNLGSSAAVFAIAASAMKSNQEDAKSLFATISVWVKEQKARFHKEKTELEPVIKAKKEDFVAIEEQVALDACEVAKGKAFAEEQYTREALLTILSDPDVCAKFIKLAQQAKQETVQQNSSAVVHESAAVNAVQDAGAA